MELNGTTFILELINFAVLVWLLKHFFYRPVMNAVDNRRKNIENTLQQALTTQEEVDALKHQYEKNLKQLDQQAAIKDQQLAKELAAKRDARMAELEKEMQEERERIESLCAHQQDENWRALEIQAANLSIRLVSQLMTKFAGKELEQLIITRMLAEIDHIPESKKRHIAESVREDSSDVKVTSAFELDSDLKKQLEQALINIVGDAPLSFIYKTDPSILSGIVIVIDSFQIEASLNGELRFFQEALRES